MDTNALQRKLAFWADEFDKAAELFPDQPCLLQLPRGRSGRSGRSGIQGPIIPRQERYQPNMIREVWERFEEGYSRLSVLAKQLYPLLKDAGAELVTNEGSTPDGSVMFWALGNKYPPPAGITVGGGTAESNPFWHVAISVRELLIEMESKPTEPEPAKPDATGSGNDPALLAQFTSLLDDTALKVMAITQDGERSVEEKLQLLSTVDVRYYGKTSKALAELLGVTEQAIRKTKWWKVDRHQDA